MKSIQQFQLDVLQGNLLIVQKKMMYNTLQWCELLREAYYSVGFLL